MSWLLHIFDSTTFFVPGRYIEPSKISSSASYEGTKTATLPGVFCTTELICFRIFSVFSTPLSRYNVVTSVATTIGLRSLANGDGSIICPLISLVMPSKSANMFGGFSVPDIRIAPATLSKIGPATSPASNK